MRVIFTGDLQKCVRQLKCHFETGQIRLSFLWPMGIEQVYVFKTGACFDVRSASSSEGRLFTLQEYKRLGGYVEPRPSGAFVYRVYPFVREDGEDVLLLSDEEAAVEVCGQIPIQFSILEKTGFFGRSKVFTICLLSQQVVESDVLCYVKKEGSYPADVSDGKLYFFGARLEAGQRAVWDVKAKKNEYVRIFVRDPDKAGIYLLRPL